MKQARPHTRREFLGRSAVAGAAVTAFPTLLPSSVFGANAPSNRVVLGAIGVGRRGAGVLNDFRKRPEVQVVAVSDVQTSRREAAQTATHQQYGNQDCAAYLDFREVLDRRDIDAVMIASPDHWHATMSIAACRAGKDVYCEKPLSLTIREGRAMVEATRTYGRVLSCGSQRVIGDYGALATAVRTGAIGTVMEARVNVGNGPLHCSLPAQPVPEDMDWDRWLGPAPWAPYHIDRCSSAYGGAGKGWRSWYDYSGGMMTDWGGHTFGGAMYGLELELAGPVRVVPEYKEEGTQLTYEFDNGKRIIRKAGNRGSKLEYVGSEGQLPGGPPRGPEPVRVPGYKGSGGIIGDFLHCVKTRELPFRDVEKAHRTATVCHLGNIAMQLHRPIRWDPETESVIGDSSATALLQRTYRQPWMLAGASV